ncbi:hypothetical protein [Paenarthrobacter sp. C1]|uniref:hypothetical protein n=1 Tax=Paenarthrobacter sp. C1 TaxID=3400220 RepID=UPI003BF5A9DC
MPTASPPPTTAAASAEPRKDPSNYAAKYTRALLARIHANTFAETCGRPVKQGGNAWACIIDHLASPDDQTIVIYLTPAADFTRATKGSLAIYEAASLSGVPGLNACVYHWAVVAADGQRGDWYFQFCAKYHDSLLP